MVLDPYAKNQCQLWYGGIQAFPQVIHKLNCRGIKVTKAPAATRAIEAMTVAREIALYNSAYRLAWKHVSELQKRDKPNLASRLHDSIRNQIKRGATEPLFIASEALRVAEFNPETWD
jgi:hypothetical protein